jgi:hypothetical protein
MAKIKGAHLLVVNVNIKEGEIKISLSVPIEEYDVDKAMAELEPYLNADHNAVDVEITPKQLPLKLPAGATKVEARVLS